jgi:hypothetical protein
MRTFGSLLGLVIVLAIVWFVMKSQMPKDPTGTGLQSPREVIDVVGVKGDLLAIAQAERMHLASQGSYASVDELQQDGAINFSGTNRRGYNFTAEVDDGQHFKITARPTDAAKAAWPTLDIDETMQVTQQ